MSELLLHPQTKMQIDALANEAPHAILITGPSGSGKGSVAALLVAQLLDLAEDSYEKSGYILQIHPEDGKSIGIESIREVEHFLSLKVPSSSAVHRAVVISDAHLLTQEAQNAVLKTLEEPPVGTVLVLTSVREEALLPTICSRVQTVQLKRPLQEDILAHFQSQGHQAAAIQQAVRMSGGLPALMHALLNQDDHPLLLATEKARALLGATTFERLLMVDELSKQKALALDTLFILQQMAHVSLQNAAGKAADRWKSVLEASYTAAEQLANSGQPKLVLTNFVVYL